jgi:MoaA/NifB/PqqE/SkfB family radical SAM enzyme
MTGTPNSALYDLARRVTVAGPDDVAFDGLRVLQHPERLKLFLTGRALDIVPVTVQLWPSLSCDVRCPTCPYRLTDARDIADSDQNLHLMPFGLFRDLVASLKIAGVKSVFLTGGGEPLLNPNIVIMASELESLGLGWGLFTNGISLNEQLAERLLQARPGFFRVSMDAGSAPLYEKIYGAGSETFERVKANVILAGRAAAKLGYNWFGVGFAVMPNVSRVDIEQMRDLLIDLIERTDLGVNFASFRPRVVHHHNDEVVVPQKWSGRYEQLAQLIRDEVVSPIYAKYRGLVRIDHKFGAFTDCDRDVAPRGGWGASWITTLDNDGNGSIIPHLTGSSTNPTAWGNALAGGDFLRAWNSDRRRVAQQSVISGKVQLSVANGFRAIDAFLEKVLDTYPVALSASEAEEATAGIENWDFHRSTRPIFVG